MTTFAIITCYTEQQGWQKCKMSQELGQNEHQQIFVRKTEIHFPSRYSPPKAQFPGKWE